MFPYTIRSVRGPFCAPISQFRKMGVFLGVDNDVILFSEVIYERFYTSE